MSSTTHCRKKPPPRAATAPEQWCLDLSFMPRGAGAGGTQMLTLSQTCGTQWKMGGVRARPREQRPDHFVQMSDLMKTWRL